MALVLICTLCALPFVSRPVSRAAGWSHPRTRGRLWWGGPGFARSAGVGEHEAGEDAPGLTMILGRLGGLPVELRVRDPQGSHRRTSVRRVIASEAMSLDGKFAGPGGDLGWHVLGPAHTAYSAELLDEVDALLFGRATYELMRAYWPTQGAEHDPEIAARMNGHVKLVASHHDLDGDWAGARRIDGDLTTAVRTAKSQPGKDIALLGSGSVLAALLGAGLVDELHIALTPVLLGAGRELFTDHTSRSLHLIRSRPLDRGTVLLVYRLLAPVQQGLRT